MYASAAAYPISTRIPMILPYCMTSEIKGSNFERSQELGTFPPPLTGYHDVAVQVIISYTLRSILLPYLSIAGFLEILWGWLLRLSPPGTLSNRASFWLRMCQGVWAIFCHNWLITLLFHNHKANCLCNWQSTTCIRATVTPNRSLFGKPPGTSLTPY